MASEITREFTPSERDRGPKVWCNMTFDPPLLQQLEETVTRASGSLVIAQRTHVSNLIAGGRDPDALDSDVALGQPHPDDIVESDRLKWVHLSTAGYTRYDTQTLRDALKSRGAILTNSSDVYAEPCAQHLVAFMLAHSRALPAAWDSQSKRLWDYDRLRPAARIVRGENATIVGFGAIGARLAEILTALGLNVTAVRRTVTGGEPVRTVSMDQVDEALASADHVFNTLPSAGATKGLFSAARFRAMRRGAVIYNVGRGDTVDQAALRDALESGHLAAAYLDVTTPEPLPANDPLWTTPNCFITPHIGGGAQGEMLRLLRHFMTNFERYLRRETLLNRVF